MKTLKIFKLSLFCLLAMGMVACGNNSQDSSKEEEKIEDSGKQEEDTGKQEEDAQKAQELATKKTESIKEVEDYIDLGLKDISYLTLKQSLSSKLSTELEVIKGKINQSTTVDNVNTEVTNAKQKIDEIINNKERTPSNGDGKTTIFLAGDSTVKTYNDSQFIGGWGQFLPLFTSSDVNVVNCAQGGRSSRSFINEGRLYNIEGDNYSFNENGGISIEDSIEEGDYLFIQFGHNDDDTKKASSYSTMFDRMSPLGDAVNGVFPTTKGTRVATTTLPKEYTDHVTSTTSALNEIAKYGSTYYSYDCGGTFKGYLKEYIDFAREMKATPVLITPVARVNFDSEGTTIIGKEGAHGVNFEYVQAVRQLAEEEDCLLIDLFADTKTLLETATKEEANYLMAEKPNDLTGTWPLDYDTIFGEASLGYTGIEATHYNKYGAYLTAAYLVEDILKSTQTGNNGKEVFGFKSSLTTTPSAYIDPSNLMTKATVANLESLFTTVNPTNPNRSYKNPADVVAEINEIIAKGEMTNDNYLEFKVLCENARISYNGLNTDDRASVTNLNNLVELENKVKEFIEANRPKPISTIVFNASSGITNSYTNEFNIGDFKIMGTSAKPVDVKDGNGNVSYNDTDYSYTKYIKLGSSYSNNNYIEFSVTGKCDITVVGKSSNSSTARVFGLYSSSGTLLTQTEAATSLAANTMQYDGDATTLRVASTSGGVYVYGIIIEYYA